MVVEMLLLILIAIAVFAYVLLPIVRPGTVQEPVEESEDAGAEEPREAVAGDRQPLRDMP